jgi:AbiV family abortive infection protein
VITLDKREAYEKAMRESIRNGRMWLDEAKILYKKMDKTHAHALMIFAGEELGKSAHCWMAVNKVMPFNHPDIDFRSKESVFKDHRLKNATALGFLIGIIESQHSEVGSEQLGLEEARSIRNFLAVMGSLAAITRERCMYVDINQERKKVHNVHSPLEMESVDLTDLLKGMTKAFNLFDTFVDMPWEFEDYFDEVRAFLVENDDRFPKRPDWK